MLKIQKSTKHFTNGRQHKKETRKTAQRFCFMLVKIITIYIYNLADPNRGRSEGSFFNSYYTKM